MGKLTDMHVGRVDGVDRPAIRKRWVIVKNEDAAVEVEKDYEGAARAAVEAIAKEGVSFSDETVEVLRALVDLLDLDVEFAAKAEDGAEVEKEDDEAEAAEGDADGEAEGDESESAEGESEQADESGEEAEAEGEEGVEKTFTADEVEAVVAKALAAAGVNVDKLTKSEAPDVTALRVAKSRQPKGQDADAADRRTVKKGEGMFANIVHGKATEPYKR